MTVIMCWCNMTVQEIDINTIIFWNLFPLPTYSSLKDLVRQKTLMVVKQWGVKLVLLKQNWKFKFIGISLSQYKPEKKKKTLYPFVKHFDLVSLFFLHKSDLVFVVFFFLICPVVILSCIFVSLKCKIYVMFWKFCTVCLFFVFLVCFCV